MKKNKRLKIKELIKSHIVNNGKEYIIVALLFMIGIFLGVLFVNNMQEIPKAEVTDYINNFIEKFKNTENINNINLLRSNIIQNVILAIIIWFFGTTVIGLPVVFGIIGYRGFCLGYTISTIISIMGLQKGLLFVAISLIPQSIIAIPTILALGVSGFKLYKSIMKDKRKENIKVEVVRHTIFSLIMLIALSISSIIEIFVSTQILKVTIKYF